MKGSASLSAGQTAEFVSAVVRQLPWDCLDPDLVQGWIENQASLRHILRDALAPPEKKSSNSLYPVTINYGLSLADMIAAGHYNWEYEKIIAEDFPITGDGKADVEIQLVHFNRYIESKEAIHEIDKMGLRLATLPELLAFGAKFPEVQHQFPVVALGSVRRDRDGDGDVPVLHGGITSRSIGLIKFGNGWGRYYRFAAIRKMWSGYLPVCGHQK